MGEHGQRVYGEVADLYDVVRPSYPRALVDDVLAYVGAAHPRVLDVGAGTGKATTLFAERGLPVVAVEPDEAMAAVARRNTAPFPAARVAVVRFEDWEPPGPFDLVVCAQAWHWLDPQVRCHKVHGALEPGGTVAVFGNLPLWDRCALRPALEAAYRAAPGLDGTGLYDPRSAVPPVVEEVGAELERSGLFADGQQRTYRWTQTYATRDYLSLLRTHSDHRRLPPGEREALLAAVGEVVDGAGGRLRLAHETRLELARRAN